MRRISHLLGFVILAGLLAGVSAAQDDSLAEAARQHRKQKEAKPVAVRQVFTNDNLPAEGTISTVGAPKSEEGQDATQNAEGTANGEQAAAAPDEKKSVDGKPAEAKPGDDPKQRQKVWENWRDKIGKQKEAVEQMQKDTEQMEKDFRLRSNTFYSSAQNRVFDGAAEARAEAAAKEQMDQRKKIVDDAKQKLEDLQEEARRAGVPSGFRD